MNSHIHAAALLRVALLLSTAATVTAGQFGDFGYTTDGQTVTITNYSGSGGNVIIPATITGLPVTGIGPFAFYSATAVTSLTIPSPVASIGVYAFESCSSLASVALPNTLALLGDGAFLYCTSLQAITLPDGLAAIGGSAFYFCTNLASVTLPGTLTTIGASAFGHCDSLAGVGLPNSVSTIGYYAFGSCQNLTRVVLGGHVEGVGDQAFAACPRLEGVYFNGPPPALGADVFLGDSRATVFCLPASGGWGMTFGGLPTAEWNLRIPTSAGNLGVLANHFGFPIVWTNGATVVVEASGSVANPAWSPVATNSLPAGFAWFSDPQAAGFPARFYRLRSL